MPTKKVLKTVVPRRVPWERRCRKRGVVEVRPRLEVDILDKREGGERRVWGRGLGEGELNIWDVSCDFDP